MVTASAPIPTIPNVMLVVRGGLIKKTRARNDSIFRCFSSFPLTPSSLLFFCFVYRTRFFPPMTSSNFSRVRASYASARPTVHRCIGIHYANGNVKKLKKNLYKCVHVHAGTQNNAPWRRGFGRKKREKRTKNKQTVHVQYARAKTTGSRSSRQ